MNFEIGSRYYTRSGEIAKVLRWNAKRSHFKCEINTPFPGGRVYEKIIYNKAGDAVKPNLKQFDLMRRLHYEASY